jgi:uncharacterized membrane-anchored protein YjiN (DUF445 family)
MRAFALLLLALAAVVFVSTLGRDGPWGYVNATAEAAMIGGIADWFAVTALFRHPLGLPIPHTALVPNRKDMLARSLQEFFTENFLSEDVVRDRVADAGVARRLGSWLSEEPHSARVADEAARALRRGLMRIRDEDVTALVEHELLPRLVEEPLSEVAGRLLGELVDDGAHHGLVDLALDEAHRWLTQNPTTFAEVLAQRAPWWTPQWLDERVTHRAHLEAIAWVRDIRTDPWHHARRALDSWLAALATGLQEDPEIKERAERFKRRVLAEPQVLAAATALWSALRRAASQALDDANSDLRARAVTSLVALGERLGHDTDLRTRVDGYAADAAAYVVERYGEELTTVITDTIRRWDGREAAQRIELHVGRDLQFIRINGTLVGGLAGLVIHTLAQLV